MEDCKSKEISNQINSKCLFNKLKSDYFLEKTFNKIRKKKSLEFIIII